MSPDIARPRFWNHEETPKPGRNQAETSPPPVSASPDAHDEMGNAPTWVVGYVHPAAGRGAEALEVLRALEAHRMRTYVPATDLAFLHAGLGHDELALDWLDRGLREHSRRMEIIGTIPVMDPLRDHPRFKKTLEAMNLPAGASR